MQAIIQSLKSGSDHVEIQGCTGRMGRVNTWHTCTLLADGCNGSGLDPDRTQAIEKAVTDLARQQANPPRSYLDGFIW